MVVLSNSSTEKGSEKTPTCLGPKLEVPWWVGGWNREVAVDVQAFTPSCLEPVVWKSS